MTPRTTITVQVIGACSSVGGEPALVSVSPAPFALGPVDRAETAPRLPSPRGRDWRQDSLLRFVDRMGARA